MLPLPARPIVYEINTAVWLHELGERAGRTVTLATVPEEEWDAIRTLGVDAVWLMGVWERSPEGRRIALAHAGLAHEFRMALPDCTDADVLASPYCVRRYRTDQRFGGSSGLAAARAALAARGISLLLDFVSNHVARDHDWVTRHPEWFVNGTREDLERDPDAWFESGGHVLACGRDPYFPPWSDVAQVNAFSDGLRAACIDTLSDVAGRSDGVRCDMAMLLLDDVFAATWGSRAGRAPADAFWPTVIGAATAHAPAFCFIAEAYWDREWILQQQGFRYCYDKRLYDRLRSGSAESVRQHLLGPGEYQERLLRFVENHDEARAAAAFGIEGSRAAAAVVLALPGGTLLHEGQLDGRRVRLPVFLQRRPIEALDADLRDFYVRLLADRRQPVFSLGDCSVCACTGWPGNESWRSLVALAWSGAGDRRLVVVNLSPSGTSGRVWMPWTDERDDTWRLRDLVTGIAYERDGHVLNDEGLYVELPPWGVHWFIWTSA